MKGIEIFTIKAISDKVKNVKLKGVYTRIYNASKGNTSQLTLPLIKEMRRIIESGSKEFIQELDALEAALKKEAKKPTKKAA